MAGDDAEGLLVLPLVRQQLHALLDLVGLRCARRFLLFLFAGGWQGLAASDCGTAIVFLSIAFSLPAQPRKKTQETASSV